MSQTAPSGTVIIGGAPIPIDDPCALYQALYAQKLALLVPGGQMEEVEYRSPVSTRRVRFAGGGANVMKALDAELRVLAAACQAKNGGRPRRHAIRAGFRAY